MIRSVKRHLVAAAVGTLAVAGGIAVAVAQVAPSSEGPEVGGGAQQVIGVFGGAGDYQPAQSPAELARMLKEDAGIRDLVVEGTIQGFEAGRIYGTPSDVDPVPTIVMRVEIGEVLQGWLPEGSQGAVYVEFDGSTPETIQADVAHLEEAVPSGTATLLYLDQLPAEGAYPGTAITRPEAGRPTGQPLFRVFNPQGLYLRDPASGRVVQPQEARRFEDAALEDLEPSRTTFPESRFVPAG